MLNDPFPPVHCRNAKWDWFNARNYCRLVGTAVKLNGQSPQTGSWNRKETELQ
jgi:hypothetical protein